MFTWTIIIPVPFFCIAFTMKGKSKHVEPFALTFVVTPQNSRNSKRQILNIEGNTSCCPRVKWSQQHGWTINRVISFQPFTQQKEMKRLIEPAGLERSKITCVPDYQKFMGGVDLVDQRISSFHVGYKTNKWTRRMFFQIINMFANNSFII